MSWQELSRLYTVMLFVVADPIFNGCKSAGAPLRAANMITVCAHYHGPLPLETAIIPAVSARSRLWLVVVERLSKWGELYHQQSSCICNPWIPRYLTTAASRRISEQLHQRLEVPCLHTVYRAHRPQPSSFLGYVQMASRISIPTNR